MCFVRISEQTETFALQNIKRLVFITEVESVYSAVRTESLYKTDKLVFKGLIKRQIAPPPQIQISEILRVQKQGTQINTSECRQGFTLTQTMS
jgi:hypothetical protein